MKKIILLVFILSFNFSFSQSIFELIKNKNHNKLETLLKGGELTEQYNKKGLTPLWLAVFYNDTVAVNILLKNKADVNFLAKNGMNSIMIGCSAKFC